MSLYVVEKGHGDWEGTTVHAVCSSREVAWKAKRKLGKFLNANRKDFFIRQILPDTIYPYGVEVNDHVLIEGKQE